MLMSPQLLVRQAAARSDPEQDLRVAVDVSDSISIKHPMRLGVRLTVALLFRTMLERSPFAHFGSSPAHSLMIAWAIRPSFSSVRSMILINSPLCRCNFSASASNSVSFA